MNLALRVIAAVIDLLQFMFFVAFFVLQAITPIGGGAVGAVSGGILCYNYSSGFWEGIVNGIACAVGGGFIGAGLSAFAIPIGMAVDTILSLTLGGALIFLMAVQGKFYIDVVLKNFLFEAAPVFAFLPFWSWMVHQSIKRSKNGLGVKGNLAVSAAGFIGGAIPGGSFIARNTVALAGRQLKKTAPGSNDQPTEQQNFRVPLVSRRFSDMRPRPAANDNTPQRTSYAA